MPPGIDDLLEPICDDPAVLRKAKKYIRLIQGLRSKGEINEIPAGINHVCAWFALQNCGKAKNIVALAQMSKSSGLSAPNFTADASCVQACLPARDKVPEYDTPCCQCVAHAYACIKAPGRARSCMGCVLKKITCTMRQEDNNSRADDDDDDDDDVNLAPGAAGDDRDQYAASDKQGKPAQKGSTSDQGPSSKALGKRRELEPDAQDNHPAKRSRAEIASASTSQNAGSSDSSASKEAAVPIVVDLTQEDDMEDVKPDIRLDGHAGRETVMRHIKLTADDVARYVESNGLKDTELLLKVLDMKTRLQALGTVYDEVVAGEGSEMLRTRLELQVEQFARSISAYVKDHGCADFDLKMKILDLGTRLQLLKA